MSTTTTQPTDAEQLQAEEQRIADIEALALDSECSSDKAAEILVKAIGEGWSRDKAKLHCIRAARQAAPAPAGHVRQEITADALSGAMMLKAGIPLDWDGFNSQASRVYKQPEWTRQSVNAPERARVMEAAHRYAGMSVYDIALEAAKLQGYNGPVTAKQSVVEAAFSGSTLTNVFTTSVNAKLLMSYMEAEDTTQGWVVEEDVNDFKDNERIRSNIAGQLEKLPRGGTAAHEDFTDEKETYKVARYAKQFVIDEQDVVDDRLDLFSTIPTKMGRAAARLRSDLVYTIILSNPTLAADSNSLFDNTNHSNFKTSAALAAATLKTAIAAIETQTDRSQTLNLRATHLLVPPTLKHTGLGLLNSIEIRDTSASTITPTANTLRTGENIMLRSEGRLENGVSDPSTDPPTSYSGASDNWYLASAMAHTIEVGYLRGTGRAPTVRTWRLSEGRYGIGWDVKMDIGAVALDYRGLIRNDA